MEEKSNFKQKLKELERMIKEDNIKLKEFEKLKITNEEEYLEIKKIRKLLKKKLQTYEELLKFLNQTGTKFMDKHCVIDACCALDKIIKTYEKVVEYINNIMKEYSKKNKKIRNPLSYPYLQERLQPPPYPDAYH
jgi:hypothetical protein